MAYRDPVSGRFVKSPPKSDDDYRLDDDIGVPDPVLIGMFLLAMLLLIIGIAYLGSQLG